MIKEYFTEKRYTGFDSLVYMIGGAILFGVPGMAGIILSLLFMIVFSMLGKLIGNDLSK